MMGMFGCIRGPMVENPVFVPPQSIENPVLVSPGEITQSHYLDVFYKVYNVVNDTFEISYSSPYDGRIVSQPRIAPGYERIWTPGSPDPRERLLATFQTIRHRCYVQIRPAEQGGYWVKVYVLKDLADMATPQGANSPAIFREAFTVDRQFEVFDTMIPSASERWINKGRDRALEQLILEKIREQQ